MKKEQAYLEKIGHLIQESRLNKNLTQADLAERIGTSQSAINRIEGGKPYRLCFPGLQYGKI